MNRYSFHPTLLLRSPAYPFSQRNAYSLQEQLNNQYFRNALFIASPSFYAELEKAGFQQHQLKLKAHRTLFNYLNRLHYRSTPFGMFSGFGLLRWQKENIEVQSVTLGKRRLHVLPTFRVNDFKEVSLNVWDDISVCANSSIYKVDQEQRFLTSDYQQEQHKFNFHIASIPEHQIIAYILDRCSQPIKVAYLRELVYSRFSLSKSDTHDIIHHLVREHLLLTDITDSILYQQKPKHLIIEQADLLDPCLVHLTEASYTGLEYKGSQGQISSEQQKHIKEGMQILQRMCPDVRPDGLRKFRTDFTRKFEGRSVPLMVALDPEIGIGYRKLEHDFQSPALLAGMTFHHASLPFKELHWTSIHAMLLDKMQHAANIQTIGIALEEKDFNAMPAKDAPLPPSLSVLFRTLKEKVYIESSGGPTATAILGRFGVFNTKVNCMLKEIAQNEVVSNPQVVFAEINSVQDAHTANVERRIKVYPYEIPLMVYPSSNSAEIIPLSDLRISISSNRIILWSERLQKEVIPRLSSAYNHSRSSLHVYRFLCDLQYQDVQTNFTFDLSHFFPSLKFYPRVTYKDAILSLAGWTIELKGIQAEYKLRPADEINDLRAYLSRLSVPRYFASYSGDQQIVFDQDSDNDLSQCWQLLKEQQTLLIKEFPFVQDTHPAKDSDGKAYLPQYVSALMHQHEVYKHTGSITHYTASEELKRVPERWIYLKIYCHASHVVDILEAVAQLAEQELRPQKLIDRFFYVIYEDPGYHLRIRFRCTTENNKGTVFQSAEKVLQRFRISSALGNVQIKTYKRELERYGPDNMETIEVLFDTDTRWILSRGLKPIQDEEAVFTVAREVSVLLGLFGYVLEDKIAHCKLMFESLFQEFDGDKNMLAVLNDKYRVLKIGLRETLSGSRQNEDTTNPPEALANQITRLLQLNSQTAGIPKVQLCSDVIHMHLNRTFTQQPREQEMVIYFLLYQHYKSILFRGRKI